MDFMDNTLDSNTTINKSAICVIVIYSNLIKSCGAWSYRDLSVPYKHTVFEITLL